MDSLYPIRNRPGLALDFPEACRLGHRLRRRSNALYTGVSRNRTQGFGRGGARYRSERDPSTVAVVADDWESQGNYGKLSLSGVRLRRYVPTPRSNARVISTASTRTPPSAMSTPTSTTPIASSEPRITLSRHRSAGSMNVAGVQLLELEEHRSPSCGSSGLTARLSPDGGASRADRDGSRAGSVTGRVVAGPTVREQFPGGTGVGDTAVHETQSSESDS